MKILVTGANGFIGRACVAAMVTRGDEVDALDLVDSACFNGIGIHQFHVCDVTALFTIPDSFDAVVHLAAHNVTHIGDTDASIYARVNVDGMSNVLSGVRARRVVFLSTTKVYSKHDGLITEDSVINPEQPYEKSKRQAEELCLRVRNSGGLIILRSVNVFGPGQIEKAVIPVFFSKAMRGAPIKIFAPRGAWLQFVYVDDLVHALMLAVSAIGVEGVFNVASEQVVRLDDLALMIKKVCGSSSDICFIDERLLPEIKVSCEKIKQKLGWSPSITVEEGIRRYHEYYVQQYSA